MGFKNLIVFSGDFHTATTDQILDNAEFASFACVQ
jgi:hypothetical protein